MTDSPFTAAPSTWGLQTPFRDGYAAVRVEAVGLVEHQVSGLS